MSAGICYDAMLSRLLGIEVFVPDVSCECFSIRSSTKEWLEFDALYYD